MKRQTLLLLVCLLILSCETDPEPVLSSDSILGFWSRETVYLNGVDSKAYVDFLNGGTNHLEIKKDKTFRRAYDNGSWDLLDRTLVLDRAESSGLTDWKYEIIQHSPENLVLETKLTEGQYCCGFDSFTDSEIITIREVYKRLN